MNYRDFLIIGLLLVAAPVGAQQHAFSPDQCQKLGDWYQNIANLRDAGVTQENAIKAIQRANSANPLPSPGLDRAIAGVYAEPDVTPEQWDIRIFTNCVAE